MAVDAVCGSRQQAKAVWARHQATVLVFTLMLLGASLRLYDIDANSLNNDEVFSIWLAGHSPSYIVQYTTVGGQDVTSPPLHYLLLHALLPVGDQPFVARSLSVLAGTLMVGVTFRLALDLFDLRVATLSSFLVAVAPMHVAFSRVGRPHMLAALCALLSLYFLARLFFGEARRWDWVGLVAVMAVAVWTFYTTFLVALFENVCVASLWLRHRLSRSKLARWLVSQAALGILLLPALLSASAEVPGVRAKWLSRPGPQELFKTAILFGTGDPSYGPTGVTPARILSSLTVVSLGVLGLWVFWRRGYYHQLDDEGRRVLFVLGAFLAPWIAIFAISQLRPIYQERYFLFAMPPLFMLFAWIFTRARETVVSSLLLVALLGLIAVALLVYYTEPSGEQWREAVAYMRPVYRSDDLVIISPGHYARPFAYYFHGSFPPDLATLAYMPALVMENGNYRPFNISTEAGGARTDDPALATANRVWLVSGYAPIEPSVLLWAGQNFETQGTGEFVGARVSLLQRTQDQAMHMTALQE